MLFFGTLMQRILLLFILLLFIGCSNKNYDLNINEEKIKKIDLLINKDNKLIFIAQHLNDKLVNIKNNTQKFYLSIYSTQEAEKLSFEITLNDKKPTTLKPLRSLSKESIKFKNINPWAKHFVVEFSEVNDKKLNLKISYNSNLAQLSFEK